MRQNNDPLVAFHESIFAKMNTLFAYQSQRLKIMNAS